MNRILLFSTLAAAGLALTVSACDEQQASDGTSVPMQQQGAAPSDSSGSAPDPLPQRAPAPETMEQLPEQPSTMQPESTQ